MGNAQVLKINECNDCLKLTNSLVRDVQSHVNLVDHAVTGLARGVDALQSTCKLLLQRKLIESKEQNEGGFASEEAEITVLEKLDEYISSNKIVMIEAVKKLFLCIKMNVNNHVENLDDAFNMLAVQNYKKLQSEDSLHCNWVTDYLYKRVEQLNIQIKRLTAQIDLQKSQIGSLNQRETTYLAEITLLSEEIRNKYCIDHKSQTNLIETKLTSNNGHLSRDSQESQSVNKRLSMKDDVSDVNLKTLDDSIQTQNQETRLTTSQPEMTLGTRIKAKVQVYRRLQFPNTKTIEKALLSKLQTEMASHQIDLEFEIRKRKAEILEHLPLVISCEHCTTTERNSCVKIALKGFDAKPSVAVVVYHNKAEPDIWKEIETYDETVPNLGGILHLGHDKGTLYSTEINERTIRKFAEFIKNNGVLRETEI